MKTVLLCGGRGIRLSEETEYKPKPLVEIGGKPILEHIMEGYEWQGFKEFILCLGYKGNMIKEYFLNLSEMNNNFLLDLKNNQKMSFSEKNLISGRIFFVDTGLNSMTGARIARIKKFIGDDEDFFLNYADGVGNVNLKKLYEHHKKTGAVITVTGVRPVYPFGLLQIENGFVTRFDEKPLMLDRVSGGFMVCNKKIFDYLSEEENCVLEQEPLKRLAQEGKMAVFEHDGYWSCMDNQKHVNELNKIYRESVLSGTCLPWKDIKNEP
jgi:glucose-1-phosphate cytidylyltransferase